MTVSGILLTGISFAQGVVSPVAASKRRGDMPVRRISGLPLLNSGEMTASKVSVVTTASNDEPPSVETYNLPAVVRKIRSSVGYEGGSINRPPPLARPVGRFTVQVAPLSVDF